MTFYQRYLRNNLSGDNSGSSDGPADGQRRDPFDNPFLVQQYLMTMLGMPSTMTSGPMEGGRMGDYVFSQDGEYANTKYRNFLTTLHSPRATNESADGKRPQASSFAGERYWRVTSWRSG